jgi:predicted amidohydrolase YtcJ
MHRRPFWFAAGALLVGAALATAQRLPMTGVSAIYYNGKILTVDAQSQVADAFAVRGDRFLAVGTNTAMRALAGTETTMVDLHGRTVVPGLIDDHNHQYDVAVVTQRGVDMKGVTSVADLLDRLRRAAAAGKPGETIFTTTGWSASTLPEQRGPSRQELDAIATDRPIIVFATRNRVQANSAALTALGIRRDTLKTGAISSGVDAAGEPDGVLTGSPAAFTAGMRRIVPAPTPEEQQAIIAKVQTQQHAMGLTGIRELQVDPDVMRAYFELWRAHALTLRTSIGLNINAGDEEKLGRTLNAWGVGPGFGDEWLRLDGIAEYNPGEQVREPYLGGDGQNTGEQRVTTERFREAILTINRLGWRPAIHITGDKTLDLVLDAYEAADRERSIRDRRWVVEHIPLVHADQIARMKRLGVVVSAQFQPFGSSDAMLKRLGSARLEQALPIRDLLDAGLVVGGGSDWPGAPNNPFLNIYFYVTRQTAGGGVVGAAQRISRLDALRLLTQNNAWLTFEEQLKGSIEPGKLADFVVLSDDLLAVPESRIRDITPVATFVGGRAVFTASPF